MGNKIAAGVAISRAESAAHNWYESVKHHVEAYAEAEKNKKGSGEWNIAVKNDGTEDFVTPDVEKSVVDTWKGKAKWNGFERRGSISSGEAKIDLKLAYPGIAESSFNYHVRVAPDPAIEQARREQAARDKKIAEEFKAKQAAEAAAKAEAEKAAKAKKAEEDARLHRVQLKANEEWNKFKKTKAWNNKIVEATWKATWIKDNGSKIK